MTKYSVRRPEPRCRAISPIVDAFDLEMWLNRQRRLGWELVGMTHVEGETAYIFKQEEEEQEAAA